MIADPKEFLAGATQTPESKLLQGRPVLIGDMGGTNARFALTAPDTEGDPVIWAIREFPVAEFSSLEDLARHYLQEAASPEIEHAVLAVASAVTGDRITITNHPWSFSIQALRRGLGMSALEVINDFAAIAAAIPYLEPCDLHTIGPLLPPRPCADLDGRFVILGPGTGLGVAGLCLQAGSPIVIESEGGHIGFAPTDTYELEVLRILLQKFSRVSTERLVSGSGLQNLYAAACAIENVPATLTEPAAITAHADEMPESPAARAVELLCGVLGSFAGDMALAFGAWDGVYLTGGVTERLLPWLARGRFRARFEAKGRFEPVLRAVPTRAITRAHIGLLGAAAKALPAVR
jgi:glucokinase